jgi:hypothetical protein
MAGLQIIGRDFQKWRGEEGGGKSIQLCFVTALPQSPHRQNRPDFNMKAGKATSEKYKKIN